MIQFIRVCNARGTDKSRDLVSHSTHIVVNRSSRFSDIYSHTSKECQLFWCRKTALLVCIKLYAETSSMDLAIAIRTGTLRSNAHLIQVVQTLSPST